MLWITWLFPLVPPILLILVFIIAGIVLLVRWVSILGADGADLNTGLMKIPTFYSSISSEGINVAAYVIVIMSVVGVVFGGIHCIGWFFNFPSSDEAMLWRVSSTVLTGIAFLTPLLAFLEKNLNDQWGKSFLLPIIFLAYVVSRLLLLVEAFISLRQLTPGMLALVKWTSFIPHF
jgi:hypothetical protein